MHKISTMSSVALTQKQLESKNHIAIKYDIPLMNYEKKVYTKTKKDHNIMTQIYGTNLSFDNWQHRYKQQKPSQVRFLSESQHTITKMSDNLNMTGTIAGKAESID